VFDRHPQLRVGVIELSSIWVPQFLLMLDGSVDFTSKLNGTDVRLAKRPSDYLLDHVRIASFSYEDPARLTSKTGDVFMCCSDYPHSEGTATPLEDYRRAGCDPDQRPGFFGDNIDRITRFEPLTGHKIEMLESVTIYPPSNLSPRPRSCARRCWRSGRSSASASPGLRKTASSWKPSASKCAPNTTWR
jgi:hypothetical protein